VNGQLYPLNRSLDGLQSRSGRSGGEENLLPPPRVYHAVPRSKRYFGHVLKGTVWEFKVFLQLGVHVPYILESNPHPFYSFRGLKNLMRIRIACGLDSRSRAGFWKIYRAAVSAVRTIH
jgi:hypothetical protein